MVIYYSLSGKTKAYAEALALKKGCIVFELKESFSRSKGVFSFIKACLDGIAKKEVAPVKMPDVSNSDEIFVCSPIWAASVAPVVRYFLSHAELKGKKVTLLITCGGSADAAYKDKASELLKDKGCAAVEVAAVSTGKAVPDKGAIQEKIDKITR